MAVRDDFEAIDQLQGHCDGLNAKIGAHMGWHWYVGKRNGKREVMREDQPAPVSA